MPGAWCCPQRPAPPAAGGLSSHHRAHGLLSIGLGKRRSTRTRPRTSEHLQVIDSRESHAGGAGGVHRLQCGPWCPEATGVRPGVPAVLWSTADALVTCRRAPSPPGTAGSTRSRGGYLGVATIAARLGLGEVPSTAWRGCREPGRPRTHRRRRPVGIAPHVFHRGNWSPRCRECAPHLMRRERRTGPPRRLGLAQLRTQDLPGRSCRRPLARRALRRRD